MEAQPSAWACLCSCSLKSWDEKRRLEQPKMREALTTLAQPQQRLCQQQLSSDPGCALLKKIERDWASSKKKKRRRQERQQLLLMAVLLQQIEIEHDSSGSCCSIAVAAAMWSRHWKPAPRK